MTNSQFCVCVFVSLWKFTTPPPSSLCFSFALLKFFLAEQKQERCFLIVSLWLSGRQQHTNQTAAFLRLSWFARMKLAFDKTEAFDWPCQHFHARPLSNHRCVTSHHFFCCCSDCWTPCGCLCFRIVVLIASNSFQNERSCDATHLLVISWRSTDARSQVIDKHLLFMRAKGSNISDLSSCHPHLSLCAKSTTRKCLSSSWLNRRGQRLCGTRTNIWRAEPLGCWEPEPPTDKWTHQIYRLHVFAP